LRLALAGVLTTGALVAFALVGGFSYTASAASAVAKATGISKAKSSNAGGNANANANANASAKQYQEKVVICHRPPGNPSNAQTLTLSPAGAQNHLAHHPDDTMGPCP
jgi:hypothetical protein